ncbi:MAG: sugar ABC transporter permease [Deltaproteobacteria bacterium]|nr:MAG: sugar ABC transporter permease [Deltaproteobacteria bacterium]
METAVVKAGAGEGGLIDLILGSMKRNSKQYTMFLALLGIWVIFSFVTDRVFLTPRNLSNLFVQTVTTAILAIGMVLVIVAGHIDLSVGSVLGFAGAVCALCMIKLEWGVIASVSATLVIGLAVGAWHGFWVAYRKVPAFIVTLASMLAFRGLIIGVTGGQTQGLEMASEATAGWFKAIGQGYLPTLAEVLRLAFVSALMGGFAMIMVIYLGIPWAVIFVLALTVIFDFVARDTTFGRHLYAIGGNPDAARLSGINVPRHVFGLFMIMGLMTAIAGIVSTSRLNAATTSAGQNAELDAIASAVIGGTSLMGGEGTIFGAVIGALVMASLDNGMSLMNLDITFQYVIKGLILLLAVWVDMAQRKK